MAFRIEHRLGIPASPQAIWDVLADIEAWPQWQSVYPEVKGALRIGARLDVVEDLPGAGARAFQPAVLDWVPDSQIHWKVANSGGLVKGVRYFEIEKLADGACIFSKGQLFEGFMTRYIPAARKRAYRDAFVAFSEALRARVVEGR